MFIVVFLTLALSVLGYAPRFNYTYQKLALTWPSSFCERGNCRHWSNWDGYFWKYLDDHLLSMDYGHLVLTVGLWDKWGLETKHAKVMLVSISTIFHSYCKPNWLKLCLVWLKIPDSSGDMSMRNMDLVMFYWLRMLELIYLPINWWQITSNKS
jgi:hypothetical protein